jgi:hypothetical protein
VKRPRPLSADLALGAVSAGFLAVVAVAGMSTSPLSPELPPDAGPAAPFTLLTRGLGLNTLVPGGRAAASIIAILFATGAFLYALWAAWRGLYSVRLIVVLGVVFIVVATALPLLFSRDVYSYTIYGRIQSLHHANPYVVAPKSFSWDRIYPLIGPAWRGTPAVYGPAFTLLSAGITKALQGNVADIWAFKIVAGVAGIALVLLVARVATSLWPERAPFAVALVAWNPVFLFNSVASGHNDVLVGLSVAAALALLAGPAMARVRDGTTGTTDPSLLREVGASGVLTLGALVKATAVVPLALLVIASVWRRPRNRRAGAVVAHGAVIGALTVAFAAPYLQSKDPTLGLATLARHVGWLAPLRLVRVTFSDAAASLWGPAAGSTAASAVRLAFALVFALAFLVIAVRTARVAQTWDGSMGNGLAAGRWYEVQGAAWAWGLLLFTLLAPVLLPWYIAWLLPVAWLLPNTGRVAVVVLSTVLAASETVAEPLNMNYPSVYHGMVLTGHYVLTPILLVTLAWLLVDLGRRVVRGRPLDDAPALRTAPSPPQVGGHVPAEADRGGEGKGRVSSDGPAQPVEGQPGQDQDRGSRRGRDREPVHHTSHGPQGPPETDQEQQQE